jgi:hypothetical protein
MTTFVQIHTLQTFPACNLNRGDDGRPKTLVYGGVERIRYSSQALKYALRNSPVLRATLGDAFGKRTKLLGRIVQEHLKKKNVPPEKAAQIGAHITEVCGKVDEKDASGLKTTTLYFIGPGEEKALYELAESAAADKQVDWNPQSILKEVTTAVDIAMFGRMYTDDSSKPPKGDKKAKGKKVRPVKPTLKLSMAKRSKRARSSPSPSEGTPILRRPSMWRTRSLRTARHLRTTISLLKTIFQKKVVLAT